METAIKTVNSASHLEKVLCSGAFAVTGELGPPKSADPELVRKKARLLKGLVDAVNITDCQTAIVRMSSIGAGLLTQAEGVEPVIQLTCRDRNRIAMQSDILGASALGLKNLLCLTGDHQKFGNHPGAKGVFDMDSIQLLGMMRNLRDEKKFQCGEPIKSHEPRLFLGCAANPFAGPNESARAARLAKKVANGANFVQTQIIYNVERFAKFMAAVRDLGLEQKVFILAGVTPPRSLGMARYMKKFVPGLDVTDEVLQRMQGAKDKEEEGIKICLEIIDRCREIKGVAGVHIMAIEWEAAVAEIVKRAGLAKRPEFALEPKPSVVEAVRAEPVELVETVETVETVAVAELKLAAAGQEAARISAAARAEAEALVAQAKAQLAPHAELPASPSPTLTSIVAAVDYSGDSAQIHAQLANAGEDEMNEKERQLALKSVTMGLANLRKAFNLSDDQFEAIAQFVQAEAILKREARAAAETSGAPAQIQVAAPQAVPPSPAPTTTTPSDPAVLKAEKTKVVEEAQKTVVSTEAKAQAATTVAVAAGEEAKAQTQAVATSKKIAEDEAKAQAKAKAQAEAAAAAKKDAEAKAQAANKLDARIKPAAREVEDAPKVAESATKPGAAEVGELARENTKLSERAGKVPASAYTQDYTGSIRQVSLGNDPRRVKVGGINALPFHLFEGRMECQPLIAMDVLDVLPKDWPESLSRHFNGVMDNAVAWARKCVNDYQAEAICLSLVSTDPNELNRPAAEAAKIAAEVSKAIEVPLIIWGCGNNEKDTETLREITAIIGDRKVCLAPLEDKNYRSLGATAMAFKHSMVASSPIDVNLAKQLNILLENLGVPLDTILMDPSVGALGYGIEYTYSVMERIRLAALTQKDAKLQLPFICNLGREVWKTKECRLPSDEKLGDQETRGVMMEAVTAACMLVAGGEVLIMRHPRAIDLTRALIKGLS